MKESSTPLVARYDPEGKWINPNPAKFRDEADWAIKMGFVASGVSIRVIRDPRRM